MEGRVELFHNGEWGTVCDDLWDMNDGHVVCRELGFYGAESVYSSATFGEGVGAILFSDVDCIGDENELKACPKVNLSTEFRPTSCLHSDDAGVRCISESGKIFFTFYIS